MLQHNGKLVNGAGCCSARFTLLESLHTTLFVDLQRELGERSDESNLWFLYNCKTEFMITV